MAPSNSLRRRFEQNQEDCTFTVLALLPSATTSILEAMNTEKITYEIQKMKGQTKSGSGESVSPPSIADTTMTADDDGRSVVSSGVQSESGLHASQMTVPSTAATSGEGTAAQDGGAAGAAAAQKARKTKRQLWDDLTISCKWIDTDQSDKGASFADVGAGQQSRERSHCCTRLRF